MKGAAATKSELLVTDTERVAKLRELLGHRFTNQGQLLVPTFRQYEALDNDDGLLLLAKEICRWIGYKPHVLTVTYRQHESQSIVTKDTISINQDFRDHPLATGGILVLATLRFIFAQKHYIPDERFIEVASIETGLGLWIMNSFPHIRSHRERLYHMLDGAWLQLEGVQLQAMTTAEYVRQFGIFTSQNRLFPEDYTKGITSRNRYVVPTHPSGSPLVFLPEPSATKQHIKKANAAWIRIFLIALIASTGFVFSIFLWTHRSTQVSTDQLNAKRSLQVIKESLTKCINQASDQQNTADPNDLFATRRIDAIKSRCESLRNQYNDELDSYQQNYRN